MSINIHIMQSGVCYYDTKSRNQTLKRHARDVGGVSVRSSAEACNVMAKKLSKQYISIYSRININLTDARNMNSSKIGPNKSD